MQVLRYGNMRELCLGLEVVTADGQVWHGLNRLRKNNTGYDLRDLFIGAEGTLGIITAAVLKLYPQPAGQVAALVQLESPEQALGSPMPNGCNTCPRWMLTRRCCSRARPSAWPASTAPCPIFG